MRKALAGSCAIYATFMIGYLLVLTLFLPSIFTYEHDWVEVGSFAEYTVEEYVTINVVENGTYTWRIISLYTDDHGNLIARINETYILEWKEDWWKSFWANETPPSGRILDINVRDGLIGFGPFWFNRYYNNYLIDISEFKLGNGTFEGEGFEEIRVGDENRLSIKLTRLFNSRYNGGRYWFDKETGLLLKSSWGFRDRFTRMIVKSTNISGNAHDGKAMIDLLVVSPLFIVPVVGMLTGLLIIKKRRYKFNPKFWVYFILFNGIILASVANFPLRAPLGRLLLGYVYPRPQVITMMMWNAFFWIGVLTVFFFPLILIRWRFSKIVD